MSEISLRHKIALGLIPHVGDINARKLVSHFGSVEAVFSESYRSLIRIPGIGEVAARYITDRTYLDRAGREADYVTRHNIRTFFYLDDDYPFRLKQCDDSPVVFFFKGNCDLNTQKILSIVGTRNATQRGREICENIIAELAVNYPGLIIVSGLAYGIDITAHKSALRSGLFSIGVLAHGFSTTYPAIHKPTAEALTGQGGLLTDFCSDMLPEKNNFLKRNRIIAGLSDATIVVESGIKGGALITAGMAGSYNRDVFAVPGKPGEQWSAGCNALIKYNKAALIETGSDIEYHLNWQPVRKEKGVQKTFFPEMDHQEREIYEYIMKEGELSIDELFRCSGIPISKLSSLLLQMEFKGFIKCFPGNIYKIC